MNASIMNWFKRVRSDLIDRHGGTVLGLETILIYLFFYTPIAVMIALSFNDSKFAIVWQGFTIKWWVSLFSGEIVAGVNPTAAWLALQNSLLIAAVTVIVSTTFGTMLALALTRYEFPGKSMLQGVTYMPIIIPSVVLGIALLLFFSFVGMTTGVGTAIIGHIAFDISYVTIIVLARLRSFDRTLEEAAKDLGAQEFETFRWVTFPVIKPGIIAGALLGFAISFDDYVVTFFIIGNDNTLPIFFFGMVRQGISPGVNVIATAILVLTFIFVGLAQWIGGLTW
jgi:spermidine/putrescine transport system permease protein